MLYIQQSHFVDAWLRSLSTALIKERDALYGKLYVCLQYIQSTGVGKVDDKHANTLAPGRRSLTPPCYHTTPSYAAVHFSAECLKFRKPDDDGLHCFNPFNY